MLNGSPIRTRKRRLGNFLLLAVIAAWGWVGVGQAGPAPESTLAGQAKPPPRVAPPVPKTSPAPRARTGPAKKAVAKPQPPAKPATGPVPVLPGRTAPVIVGRRDPFRLPPPPRPGQQVSAGGEVLGPLPPGPRGLVISQLRLEGIVRQDTSNTMIAVVDNASNRAYFLRENDAVYNGIVSKITPDSVYFQENFLDQDGRVQTREIVKRLSQAPGEVR